MIRCYLTGVELQRHQAYVLDKEAISRRLRSLRQEEKYLSALVEEFSPKNPRSQNRPFHVERQMVCRSVALSIGRLVKPFRPFISCRKRQIYLNQVRFECLYDDSKPGELFRQLKKEDLRVMAEGLWRFYGDLSPQLRRNQRIKKALVELICPAFIVAKIHLGDLVHMRYEQVKAILIRVTANCSLVEKFESEIALLLSKKQVGF